MLLVVIISIVLIGSISSHGTWRGEIDCCRNELCPFDCVRCDGQPTCYDLSDELGCNNKTDVVLQSYPKPQIFIPAVLDVIKQHLRKQKESMASTHPYGNCIRPVQHFGHHTLGNRQEETKEVPPWLALLEKLKAENVATTTTQRPPIWFQLMQKLRADARRTTTIPTTTTTTPRPTTTAPTTEQTLLDIFFEWMRQRQQNASTVKPSTSHTHYQIPVPNKTTTPLQIKRIPTAPSPTPKAEIVFTSPDFKDIYSRATASIITPTSKSLSSLGSTSVEKKLHHAVHVTPSQRPKTKIVFTSPDFEAIYSRVTAKTAAPPSKSSPTFLEKDSRQSISVTESLPLMPTTDSLNVVSTKAGEIDLITGTAVTLNLTNTSPTSPVTMSQEISTDTNFMKTDATNKHQHVHREITKMTTTATATSPDFLSIHKWDTESTTETTPKSSTDPFVAISEIVTQSIPITQTTNSFNVQSSSPGIIDSTTGFAVTPTQSQVSPVTNSTTQVPESDAVTDIHDHDHHQYHHHHIQKHNTSLTTTTHSAAEAVSIIDNVKDISTVSTEDLSTIQSSVTIQTDAQNSTPGTVDFTTKGSNEPSSPPDLLSTSSAQDPSSNHTMTTTLTEKTSLVNDISTETMTTPNQSDIQQTVAAFQSSSLAKVLLSTLATVSSGSSQFKNTVPSATSAKMDNSRSVSDGPQKEFKLFINLSDLVKTTIPVRAEDSVAVTPTAASKTITSLFSDPNQSANPTQVVYSNQPGTTGTKTPMTKLTYDSSSLHRDIKPFDSKTHGQEVQNISPVQIEKIQTNVGVNVHSNYPHSPVKPVQQYVRPKYQPKPDITASANSEIRVASKSRIPSPSPVVYQQNQLPMTTQSSFWWQPTNSPLNFDSLWGRTTTLSPITESWWPQTTVPYFWNSFFGIPHTTQRNYLVLNPARDQSVPRKVSAPVIPKASPKSDLPTIQKSTSRYSIPKTMSSSILSTKPPLTSSSYFLKPNKTPPPVFKTAVWSTDSQTVSSQTSEIVTDSIFRSDIVSQTSTPSFPTVPKTTPGFPMVPTTTPSLPMVPTTTPGFPMISTTAQSVPTVPTITPGFPMVPTTTPSLPTKPTTTPHFPESISTQGNGYPIFSYTARPTTDFDIGTPNGIPVHFENKRNQNISDLKNGLKKSIERSSQQEFRHRFENLHKNNVTSFLAKLRDLYSQIISTQQNMGTENTRIDGSSTTAMVNHTQTGYAINTTLFDAALETTTQKFVKPYESTTNQQSKETKHSWWLSSATTTAFKPTSPAVRTRRTSTSGKTSFPTTDWKTIVPSTPITTNFNTLANIPIRNRLGVTNSPIYPTVSSIKHFQFDPDRHTGKLEQVKQEYIRHGTDTRELFTPHYNISKPVLAEWAVTSGNKATKLSSSPNYGWWSKIISAVTEASMSQTKHDPVDKDLQTLTYNLFQTSTPSLPNRNSDTHGYKVPESGKDYSYTTVPYYDFTVTPPTTTQASAGRRNCKLVKDGGEFCSNKFPGYYKNAADCRTFFVCDWQNSFICHCPPNLLFDDTINVCNWDYNVQC